MRRGGPICEVLCRYGRVAEIDYQRDHRGLSTGGYQPGGLSGIGSDLLCILGNIPIIMIMQLYNLNKVGLKRT